MRCIETSTNFAGRAYCDWPLHGPHHALPELPGVFELLGNRWVICTACASDDPWAAIALARFARETGERVRSIEWTLDERTSRLDRLTDLVANDASYEKCHGCGEYAPVEALNDSAQRWCVRCQEAE